MNHLNHREKAEGHIAFAEVEPISFDVGENASLATAHAVLALLDYLQQDDEWLSDPAGGVEIGPMPKNLPPNRCGSCNQHKRIAQLEADLEAARKALRDRETITAAEMETLKLRLPDG